MPGGDRVPGGLGELDRVVGVRQDAFGIGLLAGLPVFCDANRNASLIDLFAVGSHSPGKESLKGALCPRPVCSPVLDRAELVLPVVHAELAHFFIFSLRHAFISKSDLVYLLIVRLPTTVIPQPPQSSPSNRSVGAVAAIMSASPEDARAAFVSGHLHHKHHHHHQLRSAARDRKLRFGMVNGTSRQHEEALEAHGFHGGAVERDQASHEWHLLADHVKAVYQEPGNAFHER